MEHEVRHHLESLADEDQLGDVDYAADQDFKRSEGMDFDPWYYQRGDRAGSGVFMVEDHAFVEQEWSSSDFEATGEIRFSWRGQTYGVRRPEELGDIHYVWLRGVEDAPPALELVLVRRRSWFEDVKRLFGATRPLVRESEGEAVPVLDEDG